MAERISKDEARPVEKPAPADRSDDLKTLLPESLTVDAGGQTFTIGPFTFGQLPGVLKHVGALIGAINGESLDLSALSEAGGESIIALVMIATGKPREWFDALPADEGIALMQAVLEANEDFFSRRLLPRLTLFNQALDGLKLSATSSPAGTNTRT